MGRVRRRAVTLAEAAVSIVIVGVMMVAALNVVAMSARARQVNDRLGVGPALAHDLMSEILQARYAHPDIPVVEGPEVQLIGHDAATDLKDAHVHDDQWWAQYFKPVLPDDAVSWSVTRVQFMAREDNDPVPTFVQLREAAPNLAPTNTIFAHAVLESTELTGTFAWIEKKFANTKGLAPTSGICLAFVNNNGKSAQLRYREKNVVLAGTRLSEAAPDWELQDPDQALLFYVYGKVTAPDPTAKTWGPESPEQSNVRADWDDVDDYDGWSASPPEAKDGTELTEFTGWSRAVTVEYVAPAKPGTVAVGGDQGVKRVTVVVTDPRGAQTTLVGLRGATGAYEQEVTATKTYVSWVGLDLQLGSAGGLVSLGTSLPNEPIVPDCGLKNDPCTQDADCCSGNCHTNNTCKD
jgi:hypothetical protein